MVEHILISFNTKMSVRESVEKWVSLAFFFYTNMYNTKIINDNPLLKKKTIINDNPLIKKKQKINGYPCMMVPLWL